MKSSRLLLRLAFAVIVCTAFLTIVLHAQTDVRFGGRFARGAVFQFGPWVELLQTDF